MKAGRGGTRTVDQALWRRRSAVLVVLSLLLGFVTATSGTSVRQAAAAGSLIGRWAFDEGSGTTAADSASSRPATLGAGAGWTAGIRGPFALSTNGTNTANAATSRSVVGTTSSFTVAAFAKLNALGGYQTLLSQDGSTSSGFALQLRGDTGRFAFARRASDTASTDTYAGATAAPVAGQWYHLAGVYDASAATLALYVNGSLQQTVAAPTAWNATGNFVMGRGKASGAPANFWNGAIDTVRAYDGPLTADEIEVIADSAYYKLNEGTGTTTADEGTGTYTGTLTGGAGWTRGLFGSSGVILDGVDDAVTTGPVLDPSKSYSVTAWARADQLPKGVLNTAVSFEGAQASAFSLQLSTLNRWAVVAATNDTANSGSANANLNQTITAGTWYHVAAVHDSVARTITLYVNGARANSASYTSNWTTNGTLVMGRARVNGSPTNYWPGAIEEVHAYPFVIDAAMVSTLATATPPTPETPTVTVNGTSATVTWLAPSPIAENPVTGYVVTPYHNGVAQPARTLSATTTSTTFTGLTGGTSYRYTVAATNANGTSVPSGQSTAVAANLPGAPTITAASAAPSAVNLTWSAPSSNASGITGYRVTPYIGTTAQTPQLFAASRAGSAQAVTGLRPGTSYTFRVAAENAVGYGPDSAASTAVTAGADRPAKPAPPTATAGRTSATVSWVAPDSNASAITGYVVTPYRNGTAQTAVTFSSTATTQILNGLTANTSYTFTVAATNAVGTGTASDQSAAVTPYEVPGAPTITGVAAVTESARITFTAPGANGSPITGYRVTPFIGSSAQAPRVFGVDAGTTLTVSGLTAGTAYTFRIAAENAAGYGPDSATSSSVTPNAAPTLDFNDPPSAVVGQVYSHQLTVTAGTSPYTWSVSAGTLPPGLTLSSAGLLTGTATVAGSYNFTVRVVDASGSSSTRSVTLLVSDTPTAPAAPTVTADLAGAVVSWTAPADRGSLITAYVITPYLDGTAQTPISVDPSAKTRRLTGLTVGGSYTFTIAARNANGTSTASSKSVPVTPYAALSAPAITSVTAGTASATVTWTAPTHTGGSPITGYVVTPFVGGVAQTAQVFSSAATTQTVTGLTPGTAYTFRVAARNFSGTEVLHRLNAGGPGLAAVDGGLVWSDDSGATSPLRNSGSSTTAVTTTAAADGTVPSSTPITLFNTERYDGGTAGDGGEMAWAFPVTSGADVRVRLYFANQFTGTTSLGSRVFDVALEGSTVLPEFDVIAAAGGTQIGTMREFSLAGSDGTVNIDFRHRVENPLINGFEIIRTGTATEGPASEGSPSTTPNAAPSLNFSPPPAGEVAVAYSHQLTVENGTAPFTWSFTGGTLPPGVALSATGRLSGTPTAAGTFSFTVRATDASGSSATRAVTLTVVPPPAASFNPGVGEVGVAYSAQATVAGGTGPFTWSVATGSLPGGLALNSSTGLVTGTPTTAGDSAVTVRVVDVFDQAATSTATIAIAPRPTLTTSPPAAQAGVPYSFTFAATGGTSPFRYVVVAGALPGGLTLSDGGVLSGTVFTTGTSTFTVRAVGASGGSVDQGVTFRVEQPDVAVVKTANTTSTTAGSTVTYTLTATNNAASGTYDGVRIEDPLAGVLDDAVYNGDAVATRGALGYAAATLAWTLDLPAGTTATLTYSVTVAAPVTGDHLLDGTVVTAGTSTNCNPGYADSRCSTTVPVAGLRVTTSADAMTTIPGDQVLLRFDAVNTGKTTYTDLAVELDPRGAADDATLTDPETSSGVVRPNPDGTATWTLTLAPGQRAVATTTATVKNPATGDRSLVSSATSGAPGSTCTAGSDPGCSVTVPVLLPQLTLSKVADRTETGPGEITTYTVTLRNTGETSYSAATVTDSLVGVVDDATYNADATATAGAVSYAASTLTWTADLATGATATLTYSVTVGGASGDLSLRSAVSSTAPGSTCPPGSTASACTSTVSVRPPELELRGLTSAFTLVGPSGSTSVLDRAVEMTVRTNNPPGYLVTVRAPQEVLVGGPGNDDSIPTSRLAVRHSGPGPYTPLSQDPVVVHRASRATADVGELSSYDFKIDLPFVKPDTYSTTLEYIVTAL